MEFLEVAGEKRGEAAGGKVDGFDSFRELRAGFEGAEQEGEAGLEGAMERGEVVVLCARVGEAEVQGGVKVRLED